MVLCLKARESRSLPGLLNIIWNEFFLLQVFKPPAFAGGFFFNGSSETLFADAGRFRPVFCVTETDWRSLRKSLGLALAGRSAAAAAAFLRSCFLLYILRTKNGEVQGRYTKLKGAQKCNEYEKFDTCSRKIAHCLSSSFLYNLFRNLIHVIILFLSLYLFLILFFIPGVCL